MKYQKHASTVGIKHNLYICMYKSEISQPLSLKDCVGGGRKKAMAVAESLKLIFPGVDAQGVELSIDPNARTLHRNRA